jgi:glycerol uptake facilitator-like aquaporin
MKTFVVSTLLIAALHLSCSREALATSSNESNCSVTNAGYGAGALHIICASGSINYAFLAGNSGAGTCPTTDIDILKAWVAQALVARASGLFLNVWYTDSCGAEGSQTIRAIVGIEVKGN